jgi:hypothetical protein
VRRAMTTGLRVTVLRAAQRRGAVAVPFGGRARRLASQDRAGRGYARRTGRGAAVGGALRRTRTQPHNSRMRAVRVLWRLQAKDVVSAGATRDDAHRGVVADAAKGPRRRQRRRMCDGRALSLWLASGKAGLTAWGICARAQRAPPERHRAGAHSTAGAYPPAWRWLREPSADSHDAAASLSTGRRFIAPRVGMATDVVRALCVGASTCL